MTDRGAPGLTDAEDRCDLTDDVVIRGDTGERDEVHDPLLRLSAHDMREAGLAEAAGTAQRPQPTRQRAASKSRGSTPTRITRARA